MSEHTWQPIDSAPISTDILLYVPTAVTKIQVGRWRLSANHKKVWLFGNEFGWEVGAATHWKPLPEPPK